MYFVSLGGREAQEAGQRRGGRGVGDMSREKKSRRMGRKGCEVGKGESAHRKVLF